MYSTAKAEVLLLVQALRQLDPVFLKALAGGIVFVAVLYITLWASLWIIAILQGLA